MTLTVGVTGSQGYVGSNLVKRFLRRGHTVIALDRRPPSALPWRQFALRDPTAPDLLHNIDAVVHCAYDMALTSPADIHRVNIDGMRRLLEAASRAGARFYLISSMSAYEGTQQLYGRAKLACERATLDAGETVIRLGLVYGGEAGGMIGSLQRISRLPCVPIIGRHSHQFTVEVSDMSAAIVLLVEDGRRLPKAVGLAHPDAVSFEDIIRSLARLNDHSPMFVPIPWKLVYAFMRFAEACSVRLPIRADSVLGLVRPASNVPRIEVWNDVGATLRPFDPAAVARKPA